MLTKLALFQPAETALEESALPFRKSRRPTRVATAPAKMPDPTTLQRLYQPLRRLLDFMLICLISVLALPIVLLAALAVKLTSRGPAFYTQVRVGREGKTFTIYKIRTMIHHCESLTGPRWTIPGDPRVTPIGRLLRCTHLDELPQLLNVLRGEMSLIGPRPERPEFVTELEQVIPGYQLRHQILPGITGLAQVQLPPDSDIESVRRKLLYDLYFVRHVSLWLDLRILIATGLHMLGISFSRLHRMHLVPKPSQVERHAPVPVLQTSPSLQRLAA